MRILSVTDTDLIGSRFTGYAMQAPLAALGHELEMAVWWKASNNPHVHQLKRGGLRLARATLGRVNRALALEGLLAPAGYVLPNTPFFRRADVVHWQIIHNGLISPLSFPRLSRLKPTVWTVHDAWPATGGCIHSFECEKWLTGCTGRCPHPRGRSPLRFYTQALHWRIKQRVYRQLDVTLVAASAWTRDRIARSPLLRHLPCEVIPFGIDLDAFSPGPKDAARAAFGIRPDERVLAFRGLPIAGDVFKGMRWLKAALQRYSPEEPVCLLILQDGTDFADLAGRYRVVNAGWLDGDGRVAAALSAADVFLMPSLAESFGMMAIEAMACGTPVIAGQGTALPDVIHSPHGGLAVPSRDTAALVHVIGALLRDAARREHMGREARRIAEQEYGMERYVRRHVELYESVVRRRGRQTYPPNSVP